MDWLITADGRTLWDSADPDPGFALIEPTLELALNTAGSLSFKIPTAHPEFGTLAEGTSWVRVYRDGTLVFRGRVYTVENPIMGWQSVLVEGALAVLNDSVAGPFDLKNITPVNLMRRFINDHNAQVLGPTGAVDPERRLYVGTVDIPVTHLNRSIETRPVPSTWDALIERTVGSSAGGYLILSGPDLNVLNWVADIGNISTQDLEFGENMLSVVHTADAAEMVTAIEAIGGELGEAGSGEFLHLDPSHPSVVVLYTDQGGVPHYGIRDATLEAIAGRRVEQMYWQDVKTPQTLLQKANQALQERKNVRISVDSHALELSLVDSSVPRFEVGDLVRVSVPHMQIAETLRVAEIRITLADNTGWSIRLGGTRRSLVRSANSQARAVDELIFSNYRLGEWSDAANVKLNDAVAGVADAKANAIAALLASDNLIRDPVFTSGEDYLGTGVLLRETPPGLPAGFATAGRWLANKAARTADRAVIPGHVYEVKAWVKQTVETVPAGAPNPAVRVRVYTTGGALVTQSGWLQLHDPGAFSPITWQWRAPDHGVTAVRIGFAPSTVDLFVTGWSAQDVTAAAEAVNALEGLRDEYQVFTSEVVQSLIDQSADQIKLSVRTDREVIAAILENMRDSTAPGGDILAKAVETYISNFTVDDRTISMMFAELGSVTADVDGLTTWQHNAETWINFSSSGIDMGRTTSGYRVHIDDDELTFYDGNIQLATFNNQQLRVGSVDIQGRLRIGSMEWRPGSRSGLWHLTGVQ